jgi:hypothetical protein
LYSPNARYLRAVVFDGPQADSDAKDEMGARVISDSDAEPRPGRLLQADSD